jgi:putative ABC transport system ATP-binding protein
VQLLYNFRAGETKAGKERKMMFSCTDTQNIVEINKLQKVYKSGGQKLEVLSDLSLSVENGEFVAVTGPSGNGKSTLLNMITGIDRPTMGEVLVNGCPVHLMNENELATWRGKNVGIIFQFFQLLPSISLLQNVVMPMEFNGIYRRKERRERALHLLELVGLADQANKLPGMVSGGQQQRAAIARALANDPPLLIADEPTGNLDSRSAESIFELFQGLVDDGKTMLMVTHDMEIAQRMPRIIEIRDVNIVCDSLPAPEIFSKSQPHTALVERGV